MLAIMFVNGIDLSLAARLKEIAAIKGVRENMLIGYGIVVGLKGTGDSSNEVTLQSMTRLFNKMGIEVDKAAIKSKNAAAVIVTANLPPFARIGNKIDVTVSSIGDAGSLEGGVLLVTPVRAGDQNVYAVAQGSVSLGALMDGSSKPFPTVGRVIGGATIEKDLDLNFSEKKSFRLTLNRPDFTTAARVAELINAELAGLYANARDSGSVDVIVPYTYEGKAVELLSIVENIQVNVDQKAKVVLNERSGTVVMGDRVTLLPVAIAHGDLSIEVKDRKKPGRVAELPGTNSVSDLVKALNTLGVAPKDMSAILQALKEAGALQAELEVL